ncbi:Abhydrolase-3 domain-containing protein [Mycena indigotica]|uniref:Abhydrolase-3 domain-containing protein n=1 Tax=Mycena indigotica TaxID=2126181 RepID=A0A8H6SUQ1_9AGAR|nr:Abhydrolase-3 domain-containing protein [Mycena indigotica]KAF7306238.1 Abhydrolase-3 domain-containing protein [Mycena indigotica]
MNESAVHPVLLAIRLVPLPAVLLWTLLTQTTAAHNRDKTVKRILADKFLQYLLARLPVTVTETTFDVYHRWARKSGNPVVVDELGDDARLLWLTEKRPGEDVLLVFHGGAYILPAPDFALSFWRYIGDRVSEHGTGMSVVMLNYTLAPTRTFPAQLNQARLALEFLINSGLHAQQIHVAGDSAGGNLALQLMSHMLHPHPDVPRLQLPPNQTLGGLYLLSPSTALGTARPSWKSNAPYDYMPVSKVPADDGATIRATLGVPPEYIPFAEPSRVPDDWFNGLEALVDYALVTAGSHEVMRDDIVFFADVLKKQSKLEVEMFVQSGGVHVDMALDFLVRETRRERLSSVTALFIERLATRVNASL